MKELPLHDAQIKYLGFDLILNKIQIVLHRGDDQGNCFIVKILCKNIIKIRTIDENDLDALYENSGMVYEASINSIEEDKEIIINGPDYWQLAIKAKEILYSEYSITEDEDEVFMDKNMDY